MTMTVFQPSRRAFLKNSALGTSGLIVGVSLPGTLLGQEFEGGQPNVFVRIGRDNSVTVVCGLSEMGQGVLTALPQLLAEELDVPWSSVKVAQAPADPAFKNPIFGMQATGGSTSIRGHYDPIRKAGASAREMLVNAAAQKWGVDRSECRASQGMVIHKSGKKVSYGEVAAAASKLPPVLDAKLKDPKDFKIIGKGVKRLDTAAKVNGTAKFGMDVKLPGMLTAVLARPPVLGGKPLSVDDSKAKAIPGVKQVITIPAGVAVLAEGYWAAKTGRDALAIKWDDGEMVKLNSEGVSKMLSDGATGADKVAREAGKPGSGAVKTLEATYEAPYLAHACMEPMNCTAWAKPDELEIWAGTQAQGPSQGILSKVAGVKPEQVKVNTMYLGGGFGRRFAPDFTVSATLLSMLAKAPVKLVYTREDDMKSYFYRPASVTKFTGGLDASGKLVSFTAKIASPSIMKASGFMQVPADGVDTFAVEGIKEIPYEVPNLKIEYSQQEPGVQVWFLRSVGHSQNAFFIEGFMDELAIAAGKDPYEFRRELLPKGSRELKVLTTAAEKAGWGKPLPKGRARGIALHESFGSWVAEVAEVSMNVQGQPRVHRVVCAVDCGTVVNPEIVKRQMESAIAYGLSNAMYGKITFKGGQVEQNNFHDYPILRMPDMPSVEVHIVPSTEKPGGVGEPGTPPIAPAVANAVAKLTGKRVRAMPFAEQKMTA
jgi:isoquinoline 1-oxidoreductase beta subunit